MKNKWKARNYRRALLEMKRLAPDITRLEIYRISHRHNLTEKQKKDIFKVANILRKGTYSEEVSR